MAIESSCSANANAVELDLRTDRLRYSVDAMPGVTWVLNDESEQPLLSDATLHECVWPLVDLPEGDEFLHALGMQFGDQGSLVWRVELVTTSGQLLSIVKECRYDHTGPPDEHFASLRIVITGRP